jgi:hypothetical protein
MKTELNACVERLGEGLRAFPWADRVAYGDWLAQTYYYVRHSTRLLAAAAARFGCDDVGDKLHHRFAAHMGEEKRHELLAVNDLKHLDLQLSRFGERDTTRMFYEPQYFKIEHVSPFALFGYILALEAMSATHGPEALRQVRDAHKSADAFLRVHAEDDPDHVDKALAMVEQLGDAAHAHIVQNMNQSTTAYLAMLREMATAPAGR